jgi:hypothetical protein
MLAAYRELKNGEVDTLELDVHLEGCASCRQELARSMHIGEQVRSLPVIEPLPDRHATLMRAIAKVQLEFIRRSAPGTVTTPEFLKPYIQEHVQSSRDSDLITAFSTAETGPLPIIQARRKPRHRSHMSQFAVVGLAAMFLMVLMMGGLTSLLFLAHNNLQPNRIITSVEHTDILSAQYTTSTPYQHVVSAVADRANIYYTAYGDGTNNSWMLEMLNRKTKISIPLLPTANAYSLIVLGSFTMPGSSTSGVVWLQFDGYKSNPHQSLPGHSQHPSVSLWSLHFLYLSPEQLQQAVSGSPTASEVLLQGTFDQESVPSWVTTPVQGIWFIQDSDSLLVASIDGNGISHLTSYQLATAGTPVATEIATAPTGHILTSPTATSDSTQIYWSEEWFSNAGVLSSDIWTQQVVDAVGPSHGRWAGHLQKRIVKEPFTTDGTFFRPQVVDNTLLTLCTASQAVCTNSQADASQGTPTTTGTATSTPTPSLNTSVIPQTVANIYAPPLDASVRGTILMLPLNGNPLNPYQVVNTTGLASSLQAGADFALWQGDRGYEMYDVSQGSDVTVGNTLDSATFLAVNGASAVWMVNSTTSSTTSKTGPSVTLMAFNWPK